MQFDFERFTISAKLAYRQIQGCSYSLEDALEVFRYYFETYELILEAVHPMISVSQIARIMLEMPTVERFEVYPEDYEALIDQHFATRYKGGCDYNINHFFSGKIRTMRYYETLY